MNYKILRLNTTGKYVVIWGPCIMVDCGDHNDFVVTQINFSQHPDTKRSSEKFKLAEFSTKGQAKRSFDQYLSDIPNKSTYLEILEKQQGFQKLPEIT